MQRIDEYSLIYLVATSMHAIRNALLIYIFEMLK